MDINNNSNISSMITSSISKLNLNTAARAFEANKKAPEKEVEPVVEDFKNEDIALIDDKKVDDKKVENKINVEEIQKYAETMGEKLTVDDINYGLMYGRSVIADYSA